MVRFRRKPSEKSTNGRRKRSAEINLAIIKQQVTQYYHIGRFGASSFVNNEDREDDFETDKVFPNVLTRQICKDSLL